MLDRHGLDRRAFLGVALGVVASSGAWLSACGDDDGSTGGREPASGDSERQRLGTFILQLPWLATTPSFAGTYLAIEAGVYEELGFDGGLELLPGGPSVAALPVVEQGRAHMGITASEAFAAAVRQGADLVAIAAALQRNPYCIASLPDDPIATPTDMVGKRIGVQATNEPLWSALLRMHELDPSSVEKVSVQFDPAPLANGEVDGFLAWVVDEPVTLAQRGVETELMLLADVGFTLYQQLYVVTRESLTKDRAVVRAGLEAEIVGKQMLLADPAAAVRLLTGKYAADQEVDPDYVLAYLERMVPLVSTPTTDEHGLLYMTDEDIAANLDVLGLLDLAISEDAYTHEVLDEIYADGTQLT